MKVLLLTHYFYPEVNAPASRCYEHSARWVERGVKVKVITGAPNAPGGAVFDGYRNRIRQRETIDGVEVLRVWTFIAANKRKIRRIANYLSYMVSATLAGLLGSRPDVVVATSPQFFCGWAGLIVAKLRRVPFVLEIRDIWPASIKTVGAMRSAPLLAMLEWLEKMMYRGADVIVTVGEGYQRALRKRGVPKEKISIIMNGVKPEVFYPSAERDRIRESLGLGAHFLVSYVGTLGMACGLGVVLEAAEQYQRSGEKVTFLLIGDGSNRGELEQEAKQRGVNNVRFLGLRPKEEIPGLISASDACLVHLKKTPLFETVMPSKIFEAASCGRPVILGVEGYAARFVKDANCGLLMEPESVGDLCIAIDRLRAEPDLADSLGENGRRYILANHTRVRAADDYITLLEGVADTSPDQLRPVPSAVPVSRASVHPKSKSA